MRALNNLETYSDEARNNFNHVLGAYESILCLLFLPSLKHTCAGA